MDEVEVYIEVEINPTEDPEKVKMAVENIFGSVKSNIKPEVQGNWLTAKIKGIDGLKKLYNLLRRERIRDAARGVLFDGLGENSVLFYLNKQVAYAGHISFSKPISESPLGAIKVQINCDKPREIIEWLAPRTT